MKIKDLMSTREGFRRFRIDELKRKEVKEASTKSKNADRKAKIKIVTPRVGGTSGQFEDSPVDLTEVGKAYFSDAYISRAVNKITGLMFKSGWSFNSQNSDALDYVNTRFRLMEESTGITIDELLREAGLNYVLYGNSPFVKIRGTDNLGGLKAEGYYDGDPIAAIFTVSPERFQIERDEYGNITRFNVESDMGSGVEFKPEDFLLMTYHKPSGRAFGVPHISNVIDDVLILRQIEENIARLVYRNIFPLQTYTVGLKEAGFEATEEELEEVRQMIENAPLDSIIIMPERHKLETVSNNQAIDAYNYLKYFRQRVFTGLGVSESTMGIGDSSNRSTSDNQSSDLIDLVKDFQQNFTSEFQKIVNEILFEGGYDPTLNKEEQVQFEFIEIEQAAKIARENHELQMFMANGRSIDKFLSNIGDEPVTDFSRFYFNLFGANSSSKGTVDNKDQPENQYGKQDGPTKDSLKDHFQTKEFKKDSNCLLTEQEVMVNLFLDNVDIKSVTDKIETFWRKAKHQIVERQSDIKKDQSALTSIIEKSLPLELFSSLQEKHQFVSVFEQTVLWKLNHTNNSKESLEASLYLYENSVLACYVHFLSNKERGGI